MQTWILREMNAKFLGLKGVFPLNAGISNITVSNTFRNADE